MKLVDDDEEMKRKEGSGRSRKLTVEDERKVLRRSRTKKVLNYSVRVFSDKC
jgi:hypothetical protein